MQRTKTLSFKIVVLLLIACLVMPLLQNIAVQAVDFENRFYGFEDGTRTGWYSPWSGQLSVTNEQAYTGNKSLKISGRTHSWDSPAINIYNIIKQGGPGVYMVNMAVLVDKLVDGGEYGHLLIRGNQPNTFILPRSNGNYYCKLTSTVKFVENQWHYFTGSFVVDSVDISDESDLFNLCFDFITPTANQNIYIDNVRIEKVDPLTVIPTEATLFVGDRLILDLNRYNNLVFESSRPNVATVDGNGIVRAISPGKTTITIIYNNTEVEFCDIDVKSIEDGQYFIKNVRLDNYTQLDDDGGVIVEAWGFDGNDEQRWDITYVGEGYYKITCVSGGKAITVVDTEHANVALEVSEYIGTNTQKWRIEQLDNGNFKIMPKVAIDANIDWSMAVGEGIGADGRNIEYRNYSNLNNQEKGQWELETYSVVFYGISNFGHDHSSALNNVKGQLADVGIDAVAFKEGNFAALDCKEDLLKYDVFTSRSHGQLVVSGSDSSIVVATGIVLNDEEEFEDKSILFSHYCFDESTFENISVQDNFSEVRIAMFIACHTAKGGAGANNLPTRVVEQGATAAIGFEEEILCSEANEWTKLVYKQLILGETLKDAVETACDRFSKESNIQSVVICGDENITLY